MRPAAQVRLIGSDWRTPSAIVKLYYSAVLVVLRDGEPETMAEALNLVPSHASVAKVQAAHRALIATGEEGNALRAEIARALVFIDNNVSASYEFPDPAEVDQNKVALEVHRAKLAHDRATAKLDQIMRAAQEVKEEAERAASHFESLQISAGLGVSKATDEEKWESLPSGGNGSDNSPADDAEALALAARASGATSILEHVSAMPSSAPLALTPTPPPPRLADTVDISTPPAASGLPAETQPVAASASTSSEPPRPEVEANPAEGSAPAEGSQAPAGSTEPLDLKSAVNRKPARR